MTGRSRAGLVMAGTIVLLAGGTGCAGDAVTGAATSTAHPTASSALVTVSNVDLLDPPGTYRRWEVELVADPAGTGCAAVGEPLATVVIYTVFSSAPRGVILLSPGDDPPILFPAAYGTVADGHSVQGSLTITAAASTKVIGSLDGYATIAGALTELDLTFDAPTCGP